MTGYTIINGIFRIIELAILIECIASWVPQMRYNKFMEIIQSITYPILEPCRKLQDKLNLNMPIDFSPIIAILLIDIIRNILFGILL